MKLYQKKFINILMLIFSNIIGIFVIANTKFESNDNKINIGDNTNPNTGKDKAYTITIGKKNEVGHQHAIAIGDYNKSTGKYSFAAGSWSKATKEDSIAIGRHTYATEVGSTAIGAASKAEGIDSIAVGIYSEAKERNAIAMGYLSKANKNGSVAIGYQAEAHSTNTVVLGSEIKESKKANSVYIGYKSGDADNTVSKMESEYSNDKIDDLNLKFAGGKTTGVFSIGSKGAERRLQNVAAGWISEKSTDAVNGSQLYSATKKLNSKITKNTENINEIKNKINNFDSKTNGAIAMSMAMANIPQVGDNKLFSIGVGGAYYNKEGGFAVGISGTERSNTFIYKISAGIDTRKQWSIGAGFNINFVDNTKNVSYKNFNNNPLLDEISNLKNENKIVKEKLAKLEEKINQTNSLFKEKLYIIDQFVNNSYILTKLQLEKLKLIVKEINEKYSDRIIDITGYTDTNSSDKYNLALGLKRANKISELLVNLGLKNIQNIRKVSSFGYNNKISDNFATNRRVEITLK